MSGQNRVISALDATSRAALAQWLTPIEVRAGETLIEQGMPITEVHFPVDCTLANMILMSDGRAAETACIGFEGVSGLAAFLADAPCAWQVSVQIPGKLIRVPVGPLREQAERSPELKTLLIKLSHDYQSQAAQTATCNILHSAAQRTARWLLLAMDRTDQPSIPLTHQNLSVALGLRRSTVGDVLHGIRASGAIRLGRSRVTVLDRARLEHQVCECYSRDRERTRLLGLD